jgi:hypothetical protein
VAPVTHQVRGFTVHHVLFEQQWEGQWRRRHVTPDTTEAGDTHQAVCH